MIFNLVLVAGAYLVGSVPSALLLVWAATGRDVRLEGSGNVGATNALRSAGWKIGVAVTIIDIAKGVLPVTCMAWLDGRPGWLAAAVIAPVVGHCFPVWLRFKGGKGVATGLGAFLALAPSAAGLAMVVWLVALGTTRYVSLASMIAAASFPVFLAWRADPTLGLLIAAVVTSAVIVVRHWSNLRLIAAGREPRAPAWWRRHR